MKKIFLSSLVVAFFLPALSYAASFDCAKAASTTEKLICSDEKTSTLDEQLAKSYKVGLEQAVDKDSFKKTQVEWLKQQRACKDADCLAQTYRLRIDELNKKADEKVISNKSSDTQKLKFKVIKGQQYEVCRVFNDYLNSQYYKKGDCFINNYPVDKRLRSPEFTKTDIKPYEEQEITARLIGEKDKEEQQRVAQRVKRINTENVRTAWLANVDISNSGTKDNILFSIRHESTEDANALSCPVLHGGAIDLLVDNKIDDAKWDGALSGLIIIFDGRTFLSRDGGANTYHIYEPRLLRSDENFGDINHRGILYLNHICHLDSN